MEMTLFMQAIFSFAPTTASVHGQPALGVMLGMSLEQGENLKLIC